MIQPPLRVLAGRSKSDSARRGRGGWFWRGARLPAVGGVEGGEFEDGLVAGGGAFLGQVAKGEAALHGDGAVVGRLFIENDGEERGFPGAIGADETDAVATVQLQRDVLERPSGEGLRDIGEEKAWRSGERARPGGLVNAGLGAAVDGGAFSGGIDEDFASWELPETINMG